MNQILLINCMISLVIVTVVAYIYVSVCKLVLDAENKSITVFCLYSVTREIFDDTTRKYLLSSIHRILLLHMFFYLSVCLVVLTQHLLY